MNISYRWLRDLVPGLAASPQEVADRLAMLGAPVDEVIDIGAPLRDVVIARVERAEPHPNADRLRLCTVQAGSAETLQVVCGAPNVKAGAYYPFAPVGARLPGDITIRKAKIRGETSQGMLCSARELGLGRDHEGIMELHGEFEPGRSFIDTLGLDDARLVVDITPNRPDLLSHIGVAREIAAAHELELRLHDLPGSATLPALDLVGDAGAHSRADGIELTIADIVLCPRYFGLVLRGVTIGPSPEWLAMRLRAVGLRPISNVVDATNYVLHEFGQPLHAFDLDRLGASVMVRRARPGERLKTLDGVDRALSDAMLVIADAQRPVAVAGVMGGAETEVHAGTRDILLECAYFDAQSVRATRRSLGLSTDASYRYERGIDPDAMLPALRRAAELIVAVAGGTVQTTVAAAGPGLREPLDIELSLDRVEQVLGTRFDAAQVAAFLEPLGFRAAPRDDAVHVHVQVPGHRRHDVARQEDLIEEIARRHGYDAFSDELRPFRPSSVPDHPLFAVEDRLRTLLTGRGLHEAHTAAFAPDSDGTVPLLLPLAATESRLRASLLPGLLRRVEYNFARGIRTVRLFELGTAFGDPQADGLPHESTRLAVALTGLRRPPHWSESDAPADVWDLKAVAREIAEALGLRVEEGAEQRILDATLSFSLIASHNGDVRGAAGRVAAERMDTPAWAGDVWALEVDVTAPAAARASVRFQALPQHPHVERDLALLVPEGLPAMRVAEAVGEAGGSLLESAVPFDVYSGRGVPPAMRSVAYRLRFRAADRTLTDEEVDTIAGRILERLSDDFGVRQRA